MAQAIKKKIVVCGGNGFLGMLDSVTISTQANKHKVAEYVNLQFNEDGMSLQ
jgi:hypothetical protein